MNPRVAPQAAWTTPYQLVPAPVLSELTGPARRGCSGRHVGCRVAKVFNLGAERRRSTHATPIDPVGHINSRSRSTTLGTQFASVVRLREAWPRGSLGQGRGH